jgi:hypothetical protein
MDFGDAIRALKEGKRVARAGWNGKGAWLVLVQVKPYSCGVVWTWMDKVAAMGEAFTTELPAATVPVVWSKILPWIGMKTADDCFVPWLASQSDMLAEDFEVVS